MPRVNELAKSLGIGTTELLGWWAELEPQAPQSPHATIPPEIVEQIVARRAASGADDWGASLIKAAFELARESGREDWQRMTVAVLKNRLLTLTSRTFVEEYWGVATFREFVERFSPIVALDDTTHPPTVELIAGGPPPSMPGADAPIFVESLPKSEIANGDHEPTPIERPERRIRNDLWRAVLDYTSGQAYVWENGRALAIDAADADADPRPRLPTISKDQVNEWRAEFVRNEIARGSNPSTSHALISWQMGGASTSGLASPIRGRWIGTLKRHVLACLQMWFEHESIDIPTDVVETSSAVAVHRDDGTERLRELVLRCVRGMTRAELEGVLLPPAALLRAER